MKRILAFVMMGALLLAYRATSQSVSLTWNIPSTGEVTKACGTPLTFFVGNSSSDNILVNVSGFCSPITYDWEVISFIPVYSTCTNPPEILHMGASFTPSYNPPPCTNPPSTCNPNAEITVREPGLYTFRLCASSTNCGGQNACASITLRVLPPSNFPPILTMEDITDLTLPIAGTERLGAEVEDPIDAHSFYWTQASTNPMAITLPSPGDNASNPVNRPRAAGITTTEVDISQITKPGDYCFTLNAKDEFNATSTATECFLVKPGTSTLGINITPPGVTPNPYMLMGPINNVPLNAQITGINLFNDRIRYTWSQIAGPTSIPLPPPAYTANTNDLPVASSTFNCPPINLNALNQGVYTLRLRAEDEYYPGTFVEQDITFTVIPPASNLNVTVTPSTATTDPYNNFSFSGQVTGIHIGSDVIRTYWRQDASNPVQLTTAPFNETFASPNVVPLGTTEVTSNGTLSSRIATGTYVFWYVARDIYYNVADSARIEVIVEPGKSNFAVNIDPNGERSITRTPEGWIFNVGEDPQNVPFSITGRVTGISDKTDFVRTYWQMSFTPDASGGTKNPTLPHTLASPKEIALGTTADEDVLSFTIADADPGDYDIWFVARDVFYNTADSANLKLRINRPVKIEPLEAFTPNGDGINDVWTIRNIESFPDVGVRVVNERGELVFETNSVSNLPGRGWDGRRRDGKLASEGAYYYQFFDNRDQTLITTGSFVIVR